MTSKVSVGLFLNVLGHVFYIPFGVQIEVMGPASPLRSVAARPRDSSWGSTSGSFLGSRAAVAPNQRPPPKCSSLRALGFVLAGI